MQRSQLAIVAGGIALASASFWAGVHWTRPNDSAKSKGRVADPAAVAGAKLTGPAMARNSDAIWQFTERFGLNAGTSLTAAQMKEGVSAAIRENNPLRRHQMFARLMECLTSDNAAAAHASVRETGNGPESMACMEMLAWSWATVDASAAMAQFGREGEHRGERLQGIVLSAWAAREPDDAMAWLDKNEEKDHFVDSFVEGLATRDRDAALKYAQTLTSPHAKRNAAEALAQNFMQSGVDRAAEWTQTLTDPDMREGAFSVVVEQYQRSDLTRAMEFVKPFANDPFAVGKIGQIAEAVGRENVERGLAFATMLKGVAQSKALGEVIGEWMDRGGGTETLQASEYVRKLPPEMDRDHAAWGISHRMVADDAPAAIAWAQSIKDPDIKQNALLDVAARYQKNQPAAYAEWLPRSGISEPVLSRLLQELKE